MKTVCGWFTVVMVALLGKHRAAYCRIVDNFAKVNGVQFPLTTMVKSAHFCKNFLPHDISSIHQLEKNNFQSCRTTVQYVFDNKLDYTKQQLEEFAEVCKFFYSESPAVHCLFLLKHFIDWKPSLVVSLLNNSKDKSVEITNGNYQNFDFPLPADKGKLLVQKCLKVLAEIGDDDVTELIRSLDSLDEISNCTCYEILYIQRIAIAIQKRLEVGSETEKENASTLSIKTVCENKTFNWRPSQLKSMYDYVVVPESSINLLKIETLLMTQEELATSVWQASDSDTASNNWPFSAYYTFIETMKHKDITKDRPVMVVVKALELGFYVDDLKQFFMILNGLRCPLDILNSFKKWNSPLGIPDSDKAALPRLCENSKVTTQLENLKVYLSWITEKQVEPFDFCDHLKSGSLFTQFQEIMLRTTFPRETFYFLMRLGNSRNIPQQRIIECLQFISNIKEKVDALEDTSYRNFSIGEIQDFAVTIFMEGDQLVTLCVKDGKPRVVAKKEYAVNFLKAVLKYDDNLVYQEDQKIPSDLVRILEGR